MSVIPFPTRPKQPQPIQFRTPTNVINLADHRPTPPDPWRHAQPSLRTIGPREELWSHPYFGVSLMIWSTGSNSPPEPPTTGGTPKAANVARYEKLRAVA